MIKFITIYDELGSCNQNPFADIILNLTIKTYSKNIKAYHKDHKDHKEHRDHKDLSSPLRLIRSNSIGCFEVIELSVSFN